MTYEQRVEVYGDICVKFATLFEQDATRLEQLVSSVLAMTVPKSEEPIRFYLQQIYAQFKPSKASWLFKQKQRAKKQGQFVPSTVKSKRMNAWIKDLQQLKVPERAVMFARFYLQLEDGAISELMQTPIDTVRHYNKNAATKLERILEKHELQYIYGSNFQKYFDEDFGSTYNVRRRLKQIQAVEIAVKQKPTKTKTQRHVMKWVPIVVAFLVLFSSLATPFAYHQSKKIPFLNEKFLEPAMLMNSLSQPYYQSIHDNYRMYIDHTIYMASMQHFMSKQQLDLSTFDEELKNLREEYAKYELGIYGYDVETIQAIFERFDVAYDEYYSQDLKLQVMFNLAYEQMSEAQQQQMYEYFDEFNEKYKEQIVQLYERYTKYDATQKLNSCEIVTYLFKKEASEYEEEDLTYTPQESQFCILPNGDVAYKYLENIVMYFDPLLYDLQEELQMSYSPFHYHLFYEHLANKEEVTLLEKEFMQLTQILAYTYELSYPGWIEPVTPLKSEDLIFPVD